jgi:hypothetical protein
LLIRESASSVPLLLDLAEELDLPEELDFFEELEFFSVLASTLSGISSDASEDSISGTATSLTDEESSSLPQATIYASINTENKPAYRILVFMFSPSRF